MRAGCNVERERLVLPCLILLDQDLALCSGLKSQGHGHQGWTPLARRPRTAIKTPVIVLVQPAVLLVSLLT